MKYTALKDKKSNMEKTYTVVGFENGVDDQSGDVAVDESVLSDCTNLSYKNNGLETRNGFCANQSSVIRFGEYDDTVYMPFKVTDTVYYKDGKPYNLAYCCMGNIAEAYLRIYLADYEGNILPFGEIYIHRVDYQTFNLPYNVFFAIADKVAGCGVFAFAARGTENDTIYSIYEMSEDYSEWLPMQSYIYVPTVRINGRGERYEHADNYVNLNYPAPDRPEELNLLTKRYKCYYTSDGLSSIFKLPYGNIPLEAYVSCRFYSSPEEYIEWIIPDHYNSNTKTVDGQSVVMSVNRELGVIRFYSNSEDYCVPLMPNCKLNNMLFTVQTQEDCAVDSVCTSKGAVALDNRLYFYGNSRKQNCIYCSKITNPLYIPQSSRLYLGDGTTPVTALRVQNGKLIAFKSGETYRIITNFENDLVKKEALLPENTIYLKGDTLSAQTIDNGIGCLSNQTVRLCGSRLVWLGSDKRVYALATTTYGNTTNIYCVSRPIEDRLQQADIDPQKVFAVTKDGKYMLFSGEDIFVMNYRVRGFGYSRTYYAQDDKLKSPAWYFWKTPANAGIYGGAQTGSDAILFSTFDNETKFYTITISGKKDYLMVYADDAEKKISFPIESRFITKDIDLSDQSRRKRIDAVFLSGKCIERVKLTLCDGQKNSSYNLALDKQGDFVRIAAGMPFSNKIAVGISSKEPISIRSLIIKYKLLADKG